MKLKNLLDGFRYKLVQGSLEIDIEDIHFDSRLIESKCLFSCMRRHVFDVHDYAKLAVENGVVDNPKLDLLFDKAWDMGHSSGYDEVAGMFADLSDLII